MAVKTYFLALATLLANTSYVSANIINEFTPFALVTVVAQGNISYNDLAIGLIREGAPYYIPSPNSAPFNYSQGVNQTNEWALGSAFVLNDTHIDLACGPTIENGAVVIPKYGLDFENETYDFIAGPSDANLAISIQWHVTTDTSGYGEGMPGFFIDEGGFIDYDGEVPFETFTICGGLEGFCPQCGGWITALSWRNDTSVPDLEACADVRLKAVF